MEKIKEQTKEEKNQWKEFLDDILGSMDMDFEELGKVFKPINTSKTKYVNGKDLKKMFKHIGNIIKSHHILRREQEKINKDALQKDGE